MQWSRPTRIVVLGAIVLLALTSPALIGLAADWFWFDAVGFKTVFVKTLATKVGLGLGTGFLVCAFLYYNLRFALRGLVPRPVAISPNRVLDLTQVFRRLALPAAVVLAFVIGTSMSGAWLTVLSFYHRTPFQATDPVFQRDLADYVFTVPVVSLGLGLVNGVTLLSLLLVLLLYIMRGDLIFRRRFIIEPSAQTHLGVLIALLFATTALRTYLVSIPSLLFTAGGSHIFGATFADLHANLPLLRAAGVVAALGAAAVLWGGLQRRLVPYLAVTVVTYLGIAAVLGTLIPLAVQRFSVLPNELVRETPQLRYHIAATRQAWGLEGVEVRELSGEAALTLQDIRANQGTIRNVRLWDRDPLLQTFGQLQEIRTYYDFVSVDDDRYWIDGEYRQVLLSPRELNTASLPTQNFINERLTFTHGMGLTLSPVNQITDEGLPVLFLKDLPPASSVSLAVTRPALYYGELSSDWVFVKTGQPEFDFPAAEKDAYVEYQGAGGVPLQAFWKRLLFSIHFQSLKMLLSDDITDTSRVLYHRQVSERAAKALPFLRWDSDPYLVIRDDGRLAWILDAYTATSRYPYAQPLSDGTNYMRNSVKVVIDAYDGSITPYLAEPADPLIQTYAKIFPGIFRPLADMPADLRAHVRYPEDLFRMQPALYTTYHMNEPAVFFHREDQWQTPTQAAAGNAGDPYLRHIVMKLPGEPREEYIEMTPFTPRGKDNLAAWMVARNDGEHYGQLIVYRFPRQSLVFGPTQILNRINQDTEISQQISLWDQRGSQVIRGHLLVIPIEESLIFVQALYLRAEGGRIPELKRVIVAYRNQVVMDETLEASLARLFGGDAGLAPRPLPLERAATQAPAESPGTAAASVADLIRQAGEHYDRAVAAQRAGDWTTYGTEIRQVGEVLRRLRALR
ncbi:MAG: hypothetical protein A2W29_04090 [Gemmatimonadetes bacterium RBG_16_66_8]|nr:MAG: hypothetical protein A2W29_04090 [Gemmatimonadetes bacterium RBG_16_66_8]